MKDKYYLNGIENAACIDRIGAGNSLFVYSFDPAPNLQPIGCYNDSAKERALPVFYANARGNIDWFNMELTVNQCAQVASDMGYEYFAVQFYGECYSGRNAKESYAKYGNITEGCWEFDNQTGFAVGKEGANFVYQIRK
ncbi:uncharacterized protein [Porites lutea]|uniref:uncharacterized protein n=1 Tax=Porites lutea TaxID=51062 RepID=UPI003CC6073E